MKKQEFARLISDTQQVQYKCPRSSEIRKVRECEDRLKWARSHYAEFGRIEKPLDFSDWENMPDWG